MSSVIHVSTCPKCKSELRVTVDPRWISCTVRCKICDCTIGFPGPMVVFDPEDDAPNQKVLDRFREAVRRLMGWERGHE